MQSNGKIFHFTQNTLNGKTQVLEILYDDLPPDEEFSKTYAPPDQISRPVSPAGLSFEGFNRQLRRKLEQQGSPNEIPKVDVLVPFTKRCYCSLVTGSSSMDCEVNQSGLDIVLARIELGIFESNQALTASGLEGHKLRLAHAFLVSEDYDEEGLEFSVTLSHMSGGGYATTETTNQLASVAENRDKYGGDVVSVWIDNPTSCGLAYGGNPTDESWAYSIVHWACATGYYSFGHEIAHLLGAQHDREVEGCPAGTDCCDEDGTRCKAYGWRGLGYRSVMSYGCDGQAITDPCPRVQMFSQPQKPYVDAGGTSHVIGDQWNDNASIIRTNWFTVSQNRQEIVKTEAEPAVDSGTKSLSPVPAPTLPPVPVLVPSLPPVPVTVPTLPPVPVTVPSLPPVPVQIPTLPPVPVQIPTLPPVPVQIPTLPPVPVLMPTLPPVPVLMPTLPPVPVQIPTLPPVPVLVLTLPSEVDSTMSNLTSSEQETENSLLSNNTFNGQETENATLNYINSIVIESQEIVDCNTVLPECGNGVCEHLEDCMSCPQDCASRQIPTALRSSFCCRGGPPHLIGMEYVGCENIYCHFNVDCNVADSCASEPDLRLKQCLRVNSYCGGISPDPCCTSCVDERCAA